jgi:hypothetical protein
MASKWLNVTTVILTTASLVCFTIGCFSSFSADGTMMKLFLWIGTREVADNYSSQTYFSLKALRVESPETFNRQIGFGDSACTASYCDVCSSTGSTAYLMDIVAATVCVMVAVMSAISVTFYNKNRQITIAMMAFGVAAISSASTILYLIFCGGAINVAAKRLNEHNGGSHGSYTTQYPKWGSGAIITICGASLMWVAAILQASAACVGGPSRKLVPLPTVELDLPTQQVAKQDVHYA